MRIIGCARVGAQSHSGYIEETVRPFGRRLSKGTQLAPMVRQQLDVRGLVGGMRFEQPFEPKGSRCGVRRGFRNNGHEGGKFAVHSGADRARRAFHRFERR